MGWLRNWRRKRTLAKHAMQDDVWKGATGDFPFLKGLSPQEGEKLKNLVILFLAEKEFSGARGIRITDRMRVAIAAQACLPILELGLDWYSGWAGIVLYPGDFRVRRSEVDEAGVLHEWDDELAGEAMPGGPVVLSWDAAAHDPEINVVIHEFAHKLDMLSGEPNGVPPLHAGMERRAWIAALDAAYQGFCDAVERGRDTWLDPYAVEHRSEFFAVMSEVFFTDAKEAKRRYPDLYEQFTLFFRQDPASRS
jgi:Mlc titration factor MtfA (ptsG expression regulator)